MKGLRERWQVKGSVWDQDLCGTGSVWDRVCVGPGLCGTGSVWDRVCDTVRRCEAPQQFGCPMKLRPFGPPDRVGDPLPHRYWGPHSRRLLPN